MPALVLTFGLAGVFLAMAKWAQRDSLGGSTRGELVSRTFVWFAVISITLAVGLRGYSVGVDTGAYVRNIEDVAAGRFSFYDWQSPLYYLVVLFVTYVFGGSYTALFLICGFLVGYLFCMGLWKSCPQPWLGLLIIFSFGYFVEAENQVRQLIAVGIVFYSYDYLVAGEKRKFAAACFVAFGFHASAVVSLLLLFVGKRGVGIRLVAAMLVAAAVFSFVLSSYSGLLARIPFYGNYFGSVYDYDATPLTIGNCIARCAAVLLLASLQEKVGANYSDYPQLVSILFIGALFQVFTVQSTVFGRIPIYFMVFLSIAVPEALASFKWGAKRVFAGGLIAVLISGFLVANLMFKDYSRYEYVFFWDEPMMITIR